MTQKELLYVEDAIGHECTMIKIITNAIEELEEDSLATYMEKELKNHEKIKQELEKTLEEISNEWSSNFR